ncbi:Protein MCM10 [Dirofilaria immitis]
MTMNETLGELLNLFEDDTQFKARKLANINDDNGKEIRKMDNKQQEKTSDLFIVSKNGADKKPVRSLIPIDFGCSKENDDINVQKKKTNNESSFLHSDDISSSEDEWSGYDHAYAGRSVKRQLKEVKGNFSNLLSDRMEFTKRKGLNVQANRCALQGKAQQIAKTIESSSKAALKVYDPFFGIRIRNPILSSAAFESYCDGLKKIRLSQLKSFSKSNSKWISLAIIVEKTGCRKSASGHDYMIWIVSDLTNFLNGNVKILVFGDCIKKFWKLQPGSVIALVTPSFVDGDDKQAIVKLTKCAQVLEMGFCPDFGYCKAVKKDGGLCQNVVNLSQSERCVYHIQRAAQKFTANRGSCAFLLSSPNQKLPLLESNSFSGSIITVSRRTSKVSTNNLSINGSRKNLKQQQIACLIRSKNLKECEKMTLDAIITKEAAICGTRSASQTHRKILSEEKNNESFKEFLQNQNRNKNSTHLPVLGKGLNSESVFLTSPRKICNKLNVSENAKQKAIATVMKKGGLKKADPNSFNGKPKKRRLFLSPEHKGQQGMKKSKVNRNANSKAEVREFLKETVYTTDEISALLEKRSSHEVDLYREDAVREGRYFHAMEQEEKLENYLTNIMEVKNCNVIMCIQCNYISHKQSDLCKQLHHTVKRCKANKRFFRCKQCHKRTISYERLPTAFCAHCGYNDFQRVAMKDEKKIKLVQENLLLCGEERKYVNC